MQHMCSTLLDGDANASLSDVMIFATSARSPPPMGFLNTPSIKFVEGGLPKADTSAAVLYLPLAHNGYDRFKEKMDFGILNSPSFGKPN